MSIRPDATASHTRPWRSLLFVPLSGERFLAKAHLRGADAIQLDLEDSVAPEAKPAARQRLASAVEQLVAHGIDVVVRINSGWLDALDDLKVAVRAGVAAINIPKVEDAARVRTIAAMIGELEQRAGLPVGGIALLLLIESPAALPRLAEIAAASPRTLAMTLGPEDYALAAGCSTDDDALALPNQLVAQAAAAAGLRPLGFIGSIGDFADLDAFRARIRRARRLGFVGAAVIHPAQVAICNEEFAPSADELAWARQLRDAAASAAARGEAAFAVDGRMIDPPVLQRALRLLVD